jgi:hypothetical protein
MAAGEGSRPVIGRPGRSRVSLWIVLNARRLRGSAAGWNALTGRQLEGDTALTGAFTPFTAPRSSRGAKELSPRRSALPRTQKRRGAQLSDGGHRDPRQRLPMSGFAGLNSFGPLPR